jgi:hypothetical protein
LFLRQTEQVLDADDLYTVARLEGADWWKLHQAPGGLAAHLTVKAAKSTRQNTRGAHDTFHPETGVLWSRWNNGKLGGYPLGPGRRMTELRMSPWELEIDGLVDKSLHAVFLDEGAKVALIDGVGMNKTDEVWVLVGSVFDVAQPPGSLLPHLVIPPSTTTTLALEAIDFKRVWKPVLLAANTDVEGRNYLSLSVIDTKDSFAMIPIIAGRLQTHASQLEGAIKSEFSAGKHVVLDTLGDVSMHLGPPPELEPLELCRPQAEFWMSAMSIGTGVRFSHTNTSEVTIAHSVLYMGFTTV